MRKTYDIAALILYCGLIYWLSDQSRLPTPDLFENEDKFHHFLAYAVMSVLAYRVCRHSLEKPEHRLLAAFCFCSLYGISDEWHQSFVIGRNTSAWDWLADTIGGFLGAASFYLYSKKLRRLSFTSSAPRN